jgi:hypothetical protein
MNNSQAAWKRVPTVVLTTLVPVAAALGFFAFALAAKKGPPNYKEMPSMAAFDACLSANNLQHVGGFASEFDQAVWSQEVMKVCGHEIPPEQIEASRKSAEERQSAYRDCVRGIAGSRRSGQYRKAVSICRSLLQGSEGGSTPSAPRTVGPGPIA